MRLDRRTFALAGLAGIGLLPACMQHLASIPNGGARNLLLMISDDLNDWVTALQGHPQVATPNIDRLAGSGTVFANAHAQAPICAPSRGSLFSGLGPWQTGIYGQIADDQLAPAVAAVSPTLLLPQYLRKHGFYTAGRGKVSHGGAQAGMFDEYHPRTAREGAYGPSPTKRFKWHDRRTNTDWGAYPEHDADMIDFGTAQWGTQFLQRQHDRPFMMALGFVRPHAPWYVPQAWLDKFPIEDIVLPAVLETDLADIPQSGLDLAAVPQMPTLEWAQQNGEWRSIIQAYLASIAFMDHCVGIVMEALQASGRADDTLVCFASDNGYHLGEKQRFAKMSLWGRATRVPMIFAGPGITPKVITDPVGLIDIYPTVVDLLGLPANKENAGRSLAPALTGTAMLPVQPQLSVYGRGNFAVIDARYRYIRYADGSEELYDLENDPMEWHNIADNADMAGVKARLASNIPADQAATIAPKTGNGHAT